MLPSNSDQDFRFEPRGYDGVRSVWYGVDAASAVWNGVFCELGGARERRRKLKTDIAQIERTFQR